MTLTFWRLTAHGTAGERRVRLAQYKDAPTSCPVLSGGGFDGELKAVGRWTKAESPVRRSLARVDEAPSRRLLSISLIR